MGYRCVALACLCCLPSCGGLVEYSKDDPRGDGATVDIGGEPGGPPAGPGDRPDPDLEPLPDCSGSFNEAEVMFEDPGWVSQAIAPAASGLEFFYARLAVDRSLDDSGQRLPTLRTRSTVDSDFGEPLILWELSTACESARTGTELAALDLSHDGLRLYIGCSTFAHAAGSTGPLLVLERSEVGTTFELPARVVGEVGISLGLTRDELTAYGTTLDPSIEEVLWYKRDSISDSFGPAEVASGSVAMINPEPSPDGFELWGAVDIPGTTRMEIAVSWWNEGSQEYEPPVAIGMPPPEGSSDFSPALSSDCRALYFTRFTGSGAVSQVMIARR